MPVCGRPVGSGIPGMGAGDGLLEVLPDPFEGQVQSWPAADQNIIMSRLKATAAAQSHRLAQAPPDAIAFDGIAHLLRYGKADPRRPLILALAGLKHKCRRRNLDAGRSGQKIRPLPQALHRVMAGIRPAHSGAEALAAARAAGRHNLAAAFGGHAGAETVTALPHELARLIGPFHGSGLRWSRRNAGCCWMPPPELASPAPGQGHRRQIPAAYKGGGPSSSMQRRPLTLFNSLSTRSEPRRIVFGLKKQ